MRPITKELIEAYHLRKLKLDMLGFEYSSVNNLSAHHTLVSAQNCRLYNLGDGFWKWNISILDQRCSHDLIHLIERFDPDMFYDITCELHDQIIKGYLDKENLLYIHDMVGCFMKEYDRLKSTKGNKYIKGQMIVAREKGLARVRCM